MIGIRLQVIAAIFACRLPIRTIELARTGFADLTCKASHTAVAAVSRVCLDIRANVAANFIGRFACRRLRVDRIRINRVRINRIGIRPCLALTTCGVAILIFASTLLIRSTCRLVLVFVFVLG